MLEIHFVDLQTLSLFTNHTSSDSLTFANDLQIEKAILTVPKYTQNSRSKREDKIENNSI